MSERQVEELEAHLTALRAEKDEFERIGRGFESKYHQTFEQSCINLHRAEAAEASLTTVRAELHELNQIADRYATSQGGYVGNAKGVLLSLIEDVPALRAEQERRKEQAK